MMKVTIPDYFFNQEGTLDIGNGEAVYAVYSSNRNQNRIQVQVASNVLIYLQQGRKILHGSDGDVTVETGQAVFLTEGSYCMSEVTDTDTESYRAILLFYPRKVLLDFAVRHPEIGWEVSEWEKRSFFPVDVDVKMRATLDSVTPYFYSPVPGALEIIALKFEEIFLHLLITDASGNFRNFLAGVQVSGAGSLARLFDDPDREIGSVEEMIRLSGWPKTRFYALFEEYYGRSPKKWLDDRRLHIAKTRLLSTDDSITSIAYELGYQSSSWFTQRFKSHYGMTPSQYRRDKTDKIRKVSDSMEINRPIQ